MSFAAVLDRLSRLDSPYPGLRPFEIHESHLFFGRDLQIAELVSRLTRNRFLAVLGVSGSGKSSLVRAGLLPALERGGVSEAGRRWRIVLARPAGAPFESLAASVQRVGLDPTGLRDSSHGLIDIARQLPADESLLVVIDQFEELFRYKDVEAAGEEARRQHSSSAVDAAEFVQLLLAASDHQPPVFVVITMRSDYLGDCAEFRDLPETLNDCQYLVPRLTREQRKDAIEGPLGRVLAAPSVVQRMLNDAGDEPDQLPVLQHALMRTWGRWRAADPSQARRIELQDYDAIGGFDNALNQHADELLAAVPTEIAAAIFKRLTARGRSNRERRDPATLRELWAICGAETAAQQAAVTAVVDHFRRGEATFLAPRDGEVGPDTYIDITHESLIRQWKKLRDEWVPEERRSAKTLLELAQRAAKWKAGEGETLAGLDLLDGLTWERQRNRTAAWAQHYTDAGDLDRVLEFIRASEEQERKRRFRTRTLWVVAPMLVIFAAVSVYALYQGSRASSLGRLALARQLTTQSQLVRSEQVDLEPALLLATDSLLRLDDPEGARAVREAAALLPRTSARLAHPDAIATVTFTADGRQAATAGGDDIVRVFDLAAGHKEVSRIAIKDMQPRAFSADGRRVALLDGKGGVVIADVATGNEVRHLPEAAGDLLALSPSGRYLASGNDRSRDASVRVFEIESATIVATIPHPGDLLAVAVSDSGRIATGNGFTPGVSRAGLAISDAATANTARVFQPRATTQVSGIKHNEHVTAIALTRDGRFIATGSDDKIARVFDAEQGTEIARLTHQDVVNAVAFSPDGQWVATGSDDRTARVFEASTGVEVARVTHLDKVTAVAFSPDSRRVISASHDKTARVFEAVAGAELWRVVGDDAITSAAFTADGQRLFAARGHLEAAIALVYETLTAKQVLEIKPKEPELRSLAISGDGRFLVIGGGLLGPTRVFKTDDSSHPVASINAPSPVTALGISTDGRRVATMDISNNVRVWDGTNEIARIDDPLNHDLALSGDGRRLVIGNGKPAAGAVTIFDLPEVANPQPLGQKPSAIVQLNLKEPVLAVAISEDGRWVGIAGGYQPRTTRIYEVGGKEVWSRVPEAVRRIAIDAGAGLVATADEDGIARVMQLATGKDTLSRFAAGDPVVSLRIVEKGRYLMVASRHTTLDGKYALVVFRQQLRAGDLIADACSRVTRNLTQEEWTKYVGPEVAYRKTCPAIPRP